MKKLKLLASSALVILTFSISQNTLCMEGDQYTSGSFGLLHPSHARSTSFTTFLQDSPLYHYVAIEEYRSSIQTLRQEVLVLQQKVVAFSSYSESSIVEKEINLLTETLDLQKIVLEKYGSQSEAQKKITQEIEELERVTKTNQQNISDNPSLKGLYEAQIKGAEDSIETCKKYLASLGQSESILRSALETSQKYLKTLDQQAGSPFYLKQALSEKVKHLKNRYEEHVKGLCSGDIFSHDFPKIVLLDEFGVSLEQLDNIYTERLFQLFAATMELPYAFLKTGEEKEEVYLKQLKIIKQNLINRLQEDVVGLQMSASIAKNGDIEIDLRNHNIKVEKFFLDSKREGAMINKDHDMGILKNILSSYGYEQETPSRLLDTILTQSSYGLLGLYIASLEFSPITSWNDARKVSSSGRVNNMKSKEEFSDGVVENIFLILGRHINKQVLGKIEEKLQETPEKLSGKHADHDDLWF